MESYIVIHPFFSKLYCVITCYISFSYQLCNCY